MLPRPEKRVRVDHAWHSGSSLPSSVVEAAEAAGYCLRLMTAEPQAFVQYGPLGCSLLEKGDLDELGDGDELHGALVGYRWQPQDDGTYRLGDQAIYVQLIDERNEIRDQRAKEYLRMTAGEAMVPDIDSYNADLRKQGLGVDVDTKRSHMPSASEMVTPGSELLNPNLLARLKERAQAEE